MIFDIKFNSNGSEASSDNGSTPSNSTLLKQKLNELNAINLTKTRQHEIVSDEAEILKNNKQEMYEKNIKSHFKIIRYIAICGKKN